MGKERVNQVQEAQRVPNRRNPRRNTPRHIFIKLSRMKYKEKVLKAAREKQEIPYLGIPIKLTADLSAEILQDSRDWKDIFQVIKGKKPTTNVTVLSKNLIQIGRRKQKLHRQTKGRRIQHHQTVYITNDKGTSLSRKHKGNKRPPITNQKQLSKC